MAGRRRSLRICRGLAGAWPRGAARQQQQGRRRWWALLAGVSWDAAGLCHSAKDRGTAAATQATGNAAAANEAAAGVWLWSLGFRVLQLGLPTVVRPPSGWDLCRAWLALAARAGSDLPCYSSETSAARTHQLRLAPTQAGLQASQGGWSCACGAPLACC